MRADGISRLRLKRIDGQLVGSTPVIRERLETSDLEVWMLEHLVIFDGRPISLHVTYLAANARLEGVVDNLRDLPSAFKAVHGEVMGECSTTIEAIPCESAASATLGVPLGSPILLQELLIRDCVGRPREVSYTHFRGDCVALSADLTWMNFASGQTLLRRDVG
jgi:DNA-binding GntR family transcriptional regulator